MKTVDLVDTIMIIFVMVPFTIIMWVVAGGLIWAFDELKKRFKKYDK